jgi:hypothetical protein
VINAKEGEDVYVTETIYNRETGLPVFQRTTLNGKRESPPDGSPAEIGYDEHGRVERLEWYHQGERHRDKDVGPAVIIINPENGIHVVERFQHHGKSPSPDPALGPDLIVRNRDTGEIVRQTHESEVDYSNPATRIGPAGPAP